MTRVFEQTYINAMNPLTSPLATGSSSKPAWVKDNVTNDPLEIFLEPVKDIISTKYAAVGILEHWENTSLPLFTRALELPNLDWEVRGTPPGLFHLRVLELLLWWRTVHLTGCHGYPAVGRKDQALPVTDKATNARAFRWHSSIVQP